jgi:hypothetical protein
MHTRALCCIEEVASQSQSNNGIRLPALGSATSLADLRRHIWTIFEEREQRTFYSALLRTSRWHLTKFLCEQLITKCMGILRGKTKLNKWPYFSPRSSIFLGKLIVAQQARTVLAFYGARRFVTLSVTVRTCEVAGSCEPLIDLQFGEWVPA